MCVCVFACVCVREGMCVYVFECVRLCERACVRAWALVWVGSIGCASVHVCVGRGCNREAEDVGMCVLVEKGMDGGDRDG